MGAQPSKLTESYTSGLEENSDQESGITDQYFNSIPECIGHHAVTKKDQNALVFYSTVDSRFVVSFKDLYDRSSRMASAFEDIGLQAGETVVLVSRSCPEWYYCGIGTMMVKARIFNMHLTYKDGSDIIKLMKKLANCSVLVLDPGLNDSNWNVVESLIDEISQNGQVSSSRLPYLRNIVFLSKPEKRMTNNLKIVEELLASYKPRVLQEISPDELAVIFKTSGSTGEPKLVAFTHRSLLKPRYLYRYAGIACHINQFNDGPYFWISGFMWDTIKGCTRTTISGLCPKPHDYVEFLIYVIQSEGCNLATMLPPTIYKLVKRKNELSADWPLKTIATGSQPITRSLTSCIGRICKRLCVLYGASEFNIACGFIVDDINNFVDYACGRAPFGCEIKIVNDLSEIVPVGRRGEIYVKAEWSFGEYLNDVEKTKAAKTHDGWFKTGDYGRLNADGILFVEGRLTDIIITGGENVAPFILEAVLKSHSGVEDAVIVPVPDEELYQAICACVKVTQTTITESKLREYIEQTRTDKIDLLVALPKYYMILDEFPKETTGKVSRKTVRELAERRFGSKFN